MSLFKRLFSAVKSGTTSQTDWDEIRSNLIDSDLGVKLVDEVIAIAKDSKPDDAQRAISAQISSWLSAKSREIAAPSDGLAPILLVGVNGVGKTTTCAKMANLLQKNDYKIMLAAADTFRAAAVDQLQSWGDRLNIEVVSGKPNSDPASVVFEATSAAIAAKCDYLIIDTAGRLHTKQGLMDELGKVIRVVQKQQPVKEILLVIDATTGQNGIKQALTYIEAVDVTGFIITKLDGTAKGAIALAIERASGLPIKFIGVGEQVTDLQPFDPEKFIKSLFT
jgi:fused signal recognition particle receptor